MSDLVGLPHISVYKNNLNSEILENVNKIDKNLLFVNRNNDMDLRRDREPLVLLQSVNHTKVKRISGRGETVTFHHFV